MEICLEKNKKNNIAFSPIYTSLQGQRIFTSGNHIGLTIPTLPTIKLVFGCRFPYFLRLSVIYRWVWMQKMNVKDTPELLPMPPLVHKQDYWMGERRRYISFPRSAETCYFLPINHYSAFHKTFWVSKAALKFLKFTAKLAISFCGCQSNCERVILMLNFIGKLWCSHHLTCTQFK